jgi:hypothetical protein
MPQTNLSNIITKCTEVTPVSGVATINYERGLTYTIAGNISAIRLVDANDVLIEPSETDDTHMWWIRAPRGSSFVVTHLDAVADAGTKISCEVIGDDAFVDARKVACSYEWDPIAEQWQIRLDGWQPAP